MKLFSLIPTPWKWAAGGLAMLVVLGGFVWMVNDWRAGAVKIAALEKNLQEERTIRNALDKQYRAQIEALANERLEAQARALALDELEREVNQNAKENDRTVGPVLQHYFERLHSTLETGAAPANGASPAASYHGLQAPGNSKAAPGYAGKPSRAAGQ